jgi:hypothetical protein
MKKMVALGFAILLLGLTSAQSAPPVVQPPRLAPKKVKTAAKPLASRYSKTPFDKSIARVPADYKGHDLVSLFAALGAKFKGKSEFETTEAYNTRIEAAMAESVLGELTAQSTLATVVSLSSGSEYSNLKYGADAKLLAVRKSMDEVPIDLGEYETQSKQRVLPTGIDFEKVLGSYTGQNAYGTKKKILKKEEYTCDLIMLNPKQFDFKKKEYDVLGNRQDIDFDVTMNPDVAERVVRNLKLLVVFQTAQPFVGIAKDYHSPTIDNPLDLVVHKFYIYARVAEIWLFDSKTGEVYAKLTANGEG